MKNYDKVEKKEVEDEEEEETENDDGDDTDTSIGGEEGDDTDDTSSSGRDAGVIEVLDDVVPKESYYNFMQAVLKSEGHSSLF